MGFLSFALTPHGKRAPPAGLTLNFALPSKTLYTEANVEMVILPGGDGMFGVMANHVPTITELKPGIVSVQESVGGPLTKYFVAGGFASGAPRRHNRPADARCLLLGSPPRG